MNTCLQATRLRAMSVSVVRSSSDRRLAQLGPMLAGGIMPSFAATSKFER